MKKRNSLYYLLVLLLLAGCSGEEFTETPNPTPQAGDKIAFNIGFAPQMQTRVATAPNFTSTWEVGDEIGVYIVRGNAGLQATGNHVDNMQMAYNGTDWTYTLPSGKEYYPNNDDKLHFYAYYPYDVNATNPTNITFAVQADQNGTAYNKSDLLSAKATNVAKGNAVNLQFSHAMALIQVEFVSGGVGANIDDLAKVTIKAIANTKPFSLSDNAITASTDATTDIVMHKVAGMTNTYRALVPAQTIETDKALFTVKRGGELHYITNTAAILAKAKASKYKITLAAPTLDPTHTYAVGDRYPHVGLTEGIVYAISNGGKNGKIVSLDETRNGWSWDNSLKATGATDEDNGMINIRKVYEFRPGFGNHPPFEFANSINQKYGIITDDYSNPNAKGIWYPPALNELKALYNAFAIDKTAFNAKLTAAGGTGFQNNWYWSSSEDGGSVAWVVHFDGGYSSNYLKNGSYCVRAVSAF